LGDDPLGDGDQSSWEGKEALAKHVKYPVQRAEAYKRLEGCFLQACHMGVMGLVVEELDKADDVR
jgi:hypothetical protein